MFSPPESISLLLSATRQSCTVAAASARHQNLHNWCWQPGKIAGMTAEPSFIESCGAKVSMAQNKNIKLWVQESSRRSWPKVSNAGFPTSSTSDTVSQKILCLGWGRGYLTHYRPFSSTPSLDLLDASDTEQVVTAKNVCRHGLMSPGVRSIPPETQNTALTYLFCLHFPFSWIHKW